MKINLTQATNFIAIYDKTLKESILPMKVAFKLAKIYDESTKFNEFYNTQLSKIISIHALRDETGSVKIDEKDPTKILIKPEEQSAAEKELNDLYSFEWEINNFSLSIDELPETDTSPEVMFALLPFVEIAQN